MAATHAQGRFNSQYKKERLAAMGLNGENYCV